MSVKVTIRQRGRRGGHQGQWRSLWVKVQWKHFYVTYWLISCLPFFRNSFDRGVHLLAQVGPNDSLNSIALKFNITPNKLVQLNKLFARSVYPGQVRASAVTWTTTSVPSLSLWPLAVHHHYYRSCLSPMWASSKKVWNLRVPLVPPSQMACQSVHHM